MKTVKVQEVMAAIRRKFHLDMDIYEVTENCAEVLKKMGMITLKRKVEVMLVENYCVTLEPAAKQVLSVKQLQPVTKNVIVQDRIWQPHRETLTNEVISIEPAIYTVEELNNQPKRNIPGQPKGIWVEFEWDCPSIRFNFTDFYVDVEYTTLAVDENNMPIIPEEALNACIYYNVYTYSEANILAGRIPEYLFARVEQWKDKHINQSKNRKAFSELSRNAMSELGDIYTSMDRKRTNIDS